MLYGGYARVLWDDDYEIGKEAEALNKGLESIASEWGSDSALARWCPSARDDPVAREQFGRYQRISASPAAATAYLRVVTSIDVRHALPMVGTPTLVLHTARDLRTPIEFARYMAERIPDAALVELDSTDHLIWFSDTLDAMTDATQDFLIGANPAPEVNRVLATVLVVELLDDARPLEAGVGCELIERFRGKALPHGPARIVATFDGPGRRSAAGWRSSRTCDRGDSTRAEVAQRGMRGHERPDRWHRCRHRRASLRARLRRRAAGVSRQLAMSSMAARSRSATLVTTSSKDCRPTGVSSQ